MPIAGHQDLWITGSRVYFQRDALVINGSLTKQPILDLGRVDVVSPNTQITDQTLYDGDGGVLRPIAVTRTKVDESYEIRCSNMNMNMMALLFAALPPVAFSQAASAIGPVVHDVLPGHLVKLKDASGNPVYGVASIGTIATVSGSTPLVSGTDYEFVNPERGFIKILPGSAVVTAAAQINITFTPRAISSSLRMVHPMTDTCLATGTMLLYWGRCGNRQQTVREARVTISPTASDFGNTENYANMTFRMTVLNDPTAAIPAGRLLYWLGDMPDTA